MLRERKNSLSHDVVSGSDITPCNKIDIPPSGLQIYGKRYEMMLLTTPCVYDKTLMFSRKNEKNDCTVMVLSKDI